MGDKTLRHVLLGRIHHAIVTRTDAGGPEGVAVDQALLDAAGLREHERVDVSVVTSGKCFSAAVTAAGRDSGALEVTGAASHLTRPGELVTVAAFGWMRAKALSKHVPRLVRVDDQNRPVSAPPRAPEPEAPPAPALDPFDRANLKAEKRARKLKAKAVAD